LSPTAFLKYFSIQALSAGWNDEQKAAAIQHYLVGKAGGIYNGLFEDVKKDFKEVTKALVAGCTKSAESLCISATSAKFTGECHYCRKKGHRVANRWKKREDDKETSRN
jgi:hypothetical protein